MKHLYKLLILCALLLATTLASNAQITVDATLGTPTGSYATLKQACDSINTGYHQGDINIRVHTNTTEATSARIDSSGISTGANYTSITIMPADTATVAKVILTSVAGVILFDLNGADNVKVDGRPMGLGTSRLLTFQHTATTNTASITTRLRNGVANSAFRYTNFISSNAALASAINFHFTTSAATTGNVNDSVWYCFFSGGRNNIVVAGTVANPMDNISIIGCSLLNHGNAGINVSGAVTNLLIDSNAITQTVGLAASTLGMALTQTTNSSVYTVTRNRIYDLRTTLANPAVYGIQYSPSLATPTVVPVLNCFNNFISLMQSNTSGATVLGFLYAGSQPGFCRFMHNTIRIGGTHTGGTAGGIVSAGIFKNQAIAGSTWVCRNNISINERTGGTTGIFHTAGFVSGGSITGTYDIDYNIYWASSGAGNGPFPATWISNLYGQTNQAGYVAAAAPYEQHSLFSNITFTSATDLTLSGASVNNLLTLGVSINPLVTQDIFGTTRSAPTYKGAHQAPPFTNRKDAAVKEVYTLGKLPIPYAIPHIIRAGIVNEGIDTLFGQQVDVSVTGTNTFTDTQIIDTILPGQLKYVSFNPYFYSNTGNCLVTVSVPNDSTNTNNSKSFNQIITSGVYAYAEPTLPSIGGVGFGGVGGDFIAKFPYSGSNSVNQVGVNFNTGGQPYQIVIYDILNDTPGTLLWNSSTLTSVIGINTVPVIPAVGITGSFFVGVRQTGTVNVGFGYQAEDPIRNQTFYYKSTNVTSWADFASTNSAFRFMVEPRLQVADDIGADDVVFPCKSVVLGSPSANPVVSVLNYGLNQQDSFTVSYQITGPANASGSKTFGNIGLQSSLRTTLSLSGLFNPSTAGSYTMKVWTNLILTSDLAAGNDTLLYTFDVVNTNSFSNAGNHITLSGTNQSATVNGSGNLNIQGNMLTIESWILRTASGGDRYLVCKDNESSSTAYAVYINATGQLVLRLSTISGTDSVTSSTTVPQGVYTHITAAYDGNTGFAKLYINGEEKGSKVIIQNITGNTLPLYIGRGKDATGTYFGGSIDELKIWDTARTVNQIRSGLHTRLGNFAHPNLRGYWHMDEASGIALTDATGNCNVGILTNGGTFAASGIPLGTPTVYQQSVSLSGPVAFTGSNVSINSYNQAGNNDLYIHLFNGNPEGTLPSAIPGGITTIYPANWIIYRYGTGTIDSTEITVTTTGITQSPNPADLFLYRRSPGSTAGWVLSSTASAADHALGTVTFTVLAADFSNQFSVGANNNPLPVQLLYLAAHRKESDAALRWETASELNNMGFAIERSVDGKTFFNIGFVKGNGTKVSASGYGYTDANVFKTTASNTLYYRLAQKDFNGKIIYSSVVSVGRDEQAITGETVFPNPFTDGVYIETAAQQGSELQLKVTDLQGKNLYEFSYTIPASGMIDISQLTQLPKGIYFLHTQTNIGTSVLKIVKQ